MKNYKSGSVSIALNLTLFAILLLLGAFFLPWKRIGWGGLRILTEETVTVTGEAQSQIKSQIATFSAGAYAVDDNKEKAIDEVNKKIQAIVEAVKYFGVSPSDIKTQNLSVYQNQETYYEDNRQKQRPGQWQVNNAVEIRLRNVDRATDLADLLTKSGATNVYGPNFSLDTSKQPENELVEEAMKNAREKATVIAEASGKKLGKVLVVNETGALNRVYPLTMEKGYGGGGAVVEPGSQTISKSLTVTFALE